MSYRALKLQFNLDDEALDALKEELIYAQQLAVDEEGTSAGLDGRRRGAQPAPTRLSPPSDALSPRTTSPPSGPQPPNRMPQTPNAASSPCCSVTWWTRRCSPASSTPKTGARWCGPIKTPAPR